MMPRIHTTVLAGLAFTVSGAVAAGPQKPPPPVKLEIKAPQYKKDPEPGRMYAGGWTLDFEARADPNALGVAVNSQPELYPGDRATGYVVFSDPDSLLCLPSPFFGGQDCEGVASDETYMEFTNDVDDVNVVDNVGNPLRRAALADPARSGEPEFDENRDGVVGKALVGPMTGGTVADSLGYGADDDFPGLVVLAPYGVGLVLNADFSRPAVRTLRNLAGFLNHVSYELRSASDSTVVHAGMVVPYNLIAPLMKVDDCGDGVPDDICNQTDRYSIDGAAPVDGTGGAAQFYFPELVKSMIFEIRAFVVSGVGPSTLADGNGDGKVTAADARLAGYTVLSNEAVVSVRQWSDSICAGVPLDNVIYWDYDGNGYSTDAIPCPAGPGTISKPPK